MVDSVIIEPDEGMVKEIGRQLLELADNPHDVQWATWPVTGYRVPEQLALKLKQSRDGKSDEADATQSAPRRRGRPRRQVEEQTVPGTDDTEKEE